MIQKVIIIHNPTSGSSRKIKLKDRLPTLLNSVDFDWELWESQSEVHMQELCEKAAISDAEVIVAAGGDGTVNAIAQYLWKTDKKLYILPMGSGNGFARHFGFPMKLEKVLANLSKATRVQEADVAKMNEKVFVNVAGVGFDAYISHAFKWTTQRGFWGYFKTVVKKIGYKSNYYNVRWAKGEWSGKAFLMSCANATQWGNNAVISPKSNPNDQKLNLTILKPFNYIELPFIIFHLFSGKLQTGRYFECFESATFSIETSENAVIHTDGEAHKLNTKQLDCQIIGKVKVLLGD